MGIIWTLARLTRRGIWRQSTFWLVGIITALAIVLSQFFPLFLDKDSEVKLVKDMGLSSVLLAGVILALLHGTSLFADEFETKTVLTLLSKPVRRGSLLVGKFAGILTALAPMFAVLAVILCWTVWNKESVTARGFVPAPLDWGVFQGVFLSFLEVTLLTAAAVALAARLPHVLALGICFTILVLGHLSDLLPGLLLGSETAAPLLEGSIREVASSPALAAEEAVRALIPNFGLFTMTDPIALDVPVPPMYLVWTTLYTGVYATMVLLAGSWWFEKAEL